MKKILLIVICLILSITLTNAQSQNTSPIIKIGDKNYYIHTIEAGQTVSSISRQYDISPRTIIEENPMAVETLRPGQILKIPVQVSDKQMSRRAKRKNFVEHKINAGETLYSIAKKYDISIAELMADNSNADPVTLSIGEILLIRRKGIGSSNQSELNEEMNQYKEHLDKFSDEHIHHIVVAKETVYGLSKRYETTEEELLRLNPEVAESGLKIGSIIKLPRLKPQQPSTNEQEARSEVLTFRTLPQEPEEQSFKPVDGAINVALMLPFTTDGKTNESFIDFYRGIMMALGVLKDEGLNISLSLVDTERSADKVYHTLNDAAFQYTNLIIGPVYEETFARAAAFAYQHNIPIVSPLAQVSAEFPNVFQIAPDKHKRAELLGQYLSFERNVLVIRPENDTDNEFENEIKPFLPDSCHYIEYNDLTEITIIDSLLSVEKENLVVLLSTKETLTEEILARVSSSQNTIATQGGITPRIHVLGSSKLSRFQNIDKELYFKLNVTYPTNYHSDRSNDKVAKFDEQFLDKFNKLPSAYAYRGYEVAMLFIPNIKSNLTDNLLMGKYVHLQIPYRFVRTETGKIVNNQWQLVHYKNDYTIELLNFETY